MMMGLGVGGERKGTRDTNIQTHSHTVTHQLLTTMSSKRVMRLLPRVSKVLGQYRLLAYAVLTRAGMSSRMAPAKSSMPTIAN